MPLNVTVEDAKVYKKELVQEIEAAITRFERYAGMRVTEVCYEEGLPSISGERNFSLRVKTDLD